MKIEDKLDRLEPKINETEEILERDRVALDCIGAEKNNPNYTVYMACIDSWYAARSYYGKKYAEEAAKKIAALERSARKNVLVTSIFIFVGMALGSLLGVV